MWETREFHVKRNEWGTGLMTMNVENRADVGRKFEQYQRKGFKLIDYGNFPKTNDSNAERAAKARAHSGPGGTNPWDQLEIDCKYALSQGQDSAKMRELEAKAAKTDALEEKLAEATAKLQAKNDKRSSTEKSI